ncbi:MAG: murein biosynthesis integral membrane protein MurJ [Anaerolineae bacterium]|jgi:putative peptidoglycan lipid II flippase|nr:murein biosynthesis integral membrane protein MurJ [Anaerolineae bacterium]
MSDALGVRSASVARSAITVSALFALDKALGLVRDAVIGRTFGASAALDAYYAAFELPDALFNIVAGLAMATALIPVLSAYTARGDRENVGRLTSAVINWALVVVVAISAAAAVFAPHVIRAVAPGFDHPREDLATDLMRLVLLQTVISSTSGIAMSVLQAHQHFLLPAVAPLAYTLGRILGAVALVPRWGVFGLAIGGLAGTVVHFLIQVPGLVHYGVRWRPILRHPEFGTVLRLMGPRMLGLAVTYVNFVLPTYFGSRLAAGAIASYEYGWRLMQLPETIIGTALGLTVFPTLSQRANAGDREGLSTTAGWALRLGLALAVPAAVGLLVLGRPLTALALERGAFDAGTTERVYRGLQGFALGLVTHSVLEVASRIFYAQRDMWTPLLAACAGLVVNVCVGWLLLGRLEHVGLAWANSVGAGAQVLILLAASRRRLGTAPPWALGPSLLRTLGTSAAMAVAVVAVRSAMGSGAGLLPTGLGGVAAGGLTFVLGTAIIGPRELRSLPRQILRRF